MNFYNDLICFSLNSEVHEKITYLMRNYHFKIESGGIIIGILNPAEKQIIATDLTEPQAKDRCTAVMYKRSEYGHQERMDKLWEESGYVKTYLGEWHTHNQRIPQPSFTDRRNWMQISRRKQNSEWLFFLIVGTEQIGVWTISNGEIVQMQLIDD
jgi:hypothetical protein